MAFLTGMSGYFRMFSDDVSHRGMKYLLDYLVVSVNKGTPNTMILRDPKRYPTLWETLTYMSGCVEIGTVR